MTEMNTVRVKIQNPFLCKYVVMDMPHDMKLSDMQAVSDLAHKMAIELSGSKKIPDLYAKFPVNNVGRMALFLIAKTMPDELANAQEGDFLMAMIASNRFIRQLLDRVGMRIMMEKKLYVQSVVDFCKKSTPLFEDALRMRLPYLVQQAHDTVPSDLDRAKRLGKLAEIAIKALDDLPNIFGAASYAEWKGEAVPEGQEGQEEPEGQEGQEEPEGQEEHRESEEPSEKESPVAEQEVIVKSPEEKEESESDGAEAEDGDEPELDDNAEPDEEEEEEEPEEEEEKPKRKKTVSKRVSGKAAAVAAAASQAQAQAQAKPKTKAKAQEEEEEEDQSSDDSSDLTEADINSDFGFEDDEEDEDN